MPLNVDKISTGSLSVNGTEINKNGGLAYKVYTALLTQSGGTDPLTQDSGAVEVGVSYVISSPLGSEDSWDFSNVGGPVYPDNFNFVATSSDVPNNYGTATLNYNTGAPVVTVLENTIGNIWFTYDGDGYYFVNSNGLFSQDKSWTPTIQIFNDTAGVRDGEICEIRYNNSNEYNIATFDQSGTNVNGKLQNTPIEIRVYN
jgi:hypothetical protein